MCVRKFYERDKTRQEGRKGKKGSAQTGEATIIKRKRAAFQQRLRKNRQGALGYQIAARCIHPCGQERPGGSFNFTQRHQTGPRIAKTRGYNRPVNYTLYAYRLEYVFSTMYNVRSNVLYKYVRRPPGTHK